MIYESKYLFIEMEEITTSTTWSLVLSAILFFGGLLATVRLFVFHRNNPPDHEALSRVLTSRAWTVKQAGSVLGLLFLIYFFGSCIPHPSNEGQKQLTQLLLAFLMYAAILVMINRIIRERNQNWATTFGFEHSKLGQLKLSPAIYLALLPILMITTEGSYYLLELLNGAEPELQMVSQYITGEIGWMKVLYILVAIFIAPVYEEIFFRGIIFPFIAKHYGLTASIIWTSIFFALMHFHLPSLVPLTLLSTALCLTHWRIESLWPCIGVHMIFNTVSVTALHLAG
ncbi:MAG TPA: CPBP family intramembrane glutamic endopeptidase [Pontiella sp.]